MDQVTLPDSFYVPWTGIVDVETRSLVMRIFETLAEAETYRDLVAIFYTDPQAIKGKSLDDVLKAAKKSKKPMRIVYSRYDGLGQLVDVEVLFDPTAHVH